MTVIVAALAFAAVVAVIPLRGGGRRRIGRSVRPGRADVAVGVPLAMVGCVVAGVSAPALAAVALGAVACIVAFRRRAQSRRARARRQEVVALTYAVAAEIRAGRTPAQALASVARQLPVLGVDVAMAARAVDGGGDVAAALAKAAGAAGSERLSVVAAVWSVAVGAGARVADVLDGVAAAFDAEDAAAQELAAVAAGPRATAVLLALLPIAGLGLGTVMGASPGSLLGHTRIGWLLLGAAAALDAVGLVWMQRLTQT